jgi:hypothetical protein
MASFNGQGFALITSAIIALAYYMGSPCGALTVALPEQSWCHSTARLFGGHILFIHTQLSPYSNTCASIAISSYHFVICEPTSLWMSVACSI